jgi:hypothetical protein
MSVVRSLSPRPRDVANPTFPVYTHTRLFVRAPDAPSLVSPSPSGVLAAFVAGFGHD